MDQLTELKNLLSEMNPSLTNLKADDTFEDLGMDSYAVVEFILKAEEQFGIVIDDDRILSLRTLQDVMNEFNAEKGEHEE